jgi:hypothetical protein
LIIVRDTNGATTAINPQHLLAVTPRSAQQMELHFSRLFANAGHGESSRSSLLVPTSVGSEIIGKLTTAHTQMKFGFRVIEDRGQKYLFCLPAIIAIQTHNVFSKGVYLRDYINIINSKSSQGTVDVPNGVADSLLDLFEETPSGS